jgi:hypothetical protein
VSSDVGLSGVKFLDRWPDNGVYRADRLNFLTPQMNFQTPQAVPLCDRL